MTSEQNNVCLRVATLALALLLLVTPAVSACPFCDGGPSGTNKVKEVIFGDDFWWNVFCTALPFAAFLGIAALIHFGPPLPRLRSGPGTTTSLENTGAAGR